MIDSILVSALGGGLAGAILTQIVQCFRNWFLKPAFCIEFKNEIAGCSVQNVPYEGKNSKGTKKYLRLRVFNKGRSAAKEVQVIIVRIRFETSPRVDFSGEVFDLIWSNTKDRDIRLAIPSKTPRFADVCAADHSPSNQGLEICALGNIVQLQDIVPRGKISLDVCVAAANADTVKKTIVFRFNGTADGLQIQG